MLFCTQGRRAGHEGARQSGAIINFGSISWHLGSAGSGDLRDRQGGHRRHEPRARARARPGRYPRHDGGSGQRAHAAADEMVLAGSRGRDRRAAVPQTTRRAQRCRRRLCCSWRRTMPACAPATNTGSMPAGDELATRMRLARWAPSWAKARSGPRANRRSGSSTSSRSTSIALHAATGELESWDAPAPPGFIAPASRRRIHCGHEERPLPLRSGGRRVRPVAMPSSRTSPATG